MSSSGSQICLNDLHMHKFVSCYCERCKRFKTFEQLLGSLKTASKAVNYEEQISVVVRNICAVCI